MWSACARGPGSCTLRAIFALIHRSAWKGSSANYFAQTGFSEVRVAPILRLRRSGRLAASALDQGG
jgi:hypothetical protein